MDIFHVEHKGVHRSLTADRGPIHAVALPRRLTRAVCHQTPSDQEVEDIMRGAAGAPVPEEKL
ncbi:hypothetical protein DOTSEDRAFT_46310 [Dothistroma septosporum NZE10]|uniref:Uncharacterized protein n=1 Tax=Dothistroma septosporum (strain NZE10 / CBS 128990) TaxID=675120 RepID=N1PFA3_DOTSN|nr:hypothetical protein DOTSEDRAFT_46310 [Dothistroma septosporum NZE10]